MTDHPSTPLLLQALGFRAPDRPLHVGTFWRGGRKPTHTLCGTKLTTHRTLALPFKDWDQVLCDRCGAEMDRFSDLIDRAKEGDDE